jgi:hypothetical protein
MRFSVAIAESAARSSSSGCRERRVARGELHCPRALARPWSPPVSDQAHARAAGGRGRRSECDRHVDVLGNFSITSTMPSGPPSHGRRGQCGGWRASSASRQPGDHHRRGVSADRRRARESPASSPRPAARRAAANAQHQQVPWPAAWRSAIARSADDRHGAPTATSAYVARSGRQPGWRRRLSDEAKSSAKRRRRRSTS